MEKSFHLFSQYNQTRILGSKIETPALTKKAITERDVKAIAVLLTPNKETDRFFQAVQKEITISDLNKFATNEKFLGEAKFNIREEFAGISQDLNILDESKVKIGKTNEAVAKERNISINSVANSRKQIELYKICPKLSPDRRTE